MKTFSLAEYDLNVTEVHHNLPPSALYEHAIRYEKTRASRRMARSSPIPARRPDARRRTANRQESGVGTRHLVGAREHPCDEHVFEINASALSIPQHAREALLRRWFRRMGSEVSHEGPRHLLAAVSRPLHAPMLIARHTMNVRNFGAPDFVVYNAGAFRRIVSPLGWVRRRASTSVSEDKALVILGTDMPAR